MSSAIDKIKQHQDVELAAAISTLKKDPKQLQNFLQQQQDKVYKSITQQKDSTFDKVYGDLQRASKTHETGVLANTRNNDLAHLQEQLYQTQKSKADAILHDKDLASRKHEMNEWTVHNKNDTLFVFSALFIMLSGLLLFVVLWRLGVVSSSVCAALCAPLIIVFVFIVVRRSQYTDILRNKRYWNKQSFEGKYGTIPLPNICPGGLDALDRGISSAGKGISNAASSATNYAANSISQGANSVAQSAQRIAPQAQQQQAQQQHAQQQQAQVKGPQ